VIRGEKYKERKMCIIGVFQKKMYEYYYLLIYNRKNILFIGLFLHGLIVVFYFSNITIAQNDILLF